MRVRSLMAGTAAAVTLAGLVPALAVADPVPAASAVVSVTVDANDPVVGARVVARDAATGQAASSVATTGRYGYAVIRMFPGQSDARVVVTSTGGAARVGGTLAGTADAMSTTLTRGDAFAAVDIGINPATTVKSAYMGLRPGASDDVAERTVARGLGVRGNLELAEAAGYSNRPFSGAVFAKAADRRGGLTAYAKWAARRIATSGKAPSYVSRAPVDVLPLRSGSGIATNPAARRSANEGSIVGAIGVDLLVHTVGSVLDSATDPVLCSMGLTFMCDKPESPAPAPAALPAELTAKLNDIQANIGNLRTNLTSIQGQIAGVDNAVADLPVQLTALDYAREADAVWAVLRSAQVTSSLALEGKTDARAASTFENALHQLFDLNHGCPMWVALIGRLPSAALSDGSGARYPNAACTASAGGIGTDFGLMQYAQRRYAATLPFVSAGAVQDSVDAAGEFWLGRFAQDIMASSMAAAWATRTSPPRSAVSREDWDQTWSLFADVMGAVDSDATGAYFGQRIPPTQVVKMTTGLQGKVYAFGTFKDPGECWGNSLATFVAGYGGSSYEPDGAMGAACSDFVTPPPPDAIVAATPTAPSAWTLLDAWPDGHKDALRPPLQDAAYCQMLAKGDWTGTTLPTGEPLSCRTFPQAIPTTVVTGTTQATLPNLQVSLGNTGCRPWLFGTYASTTYLAPGAHYPNQATGMQCPVTDLTPGASDVDGWNCVLANPDGSVLVGRRATADDGSGYWRFTPWKVTSSLPQLNTRTMGGYCPSVSGKPRGDASADAASAGNVDALRPTSSGGVLLCSAGFNAPDMASSIQRGYGGAGNPCMNNTDGSWPLPRLITGLTTFYWQSYPSGQDRYATPGYRDPRWTSNNDVAGDYVVGPLYTSSVVGGYIPTAYPGANINAPQATRFAPRAPGMPRNVEVCGGACTGDDGSLLVMWDPPASTGTSLITRYDVVAQGATTNARVGSCSAPGRVTRCTIKGAVAGDVVVSVVAVNATGASQPSTATLVSAGVQRPTVTAGDSALTVSWASPWGSVPSAWQRAAGGQAPSVTYTATALPGGASCTGTGITATTCTITGLTPRVAYTVTVQARVRFAGGPATDYITHPSAPSQGVAPDGPPSPPDAPSIAAATAAAGRISVDWTAPESDGGARITGYIATAQPGGVTCITTGATQCTIDGLDDATRYAVTVVAVNALGTSPPSVAALATTPTVVPGSPRTPVALATSGRLDVRWVAPLADGGRAITGYTATAQPGGASCATTGATGCSIGGLDDSTQYTVAVTATNDVGTGLPATAVIVTTPVAVPSAPRPPAVTPLPGRIVVSWAPPDATGGSAITGYVATAQPGGATCTTTGVTQCTITGLSNDTNYTVTVAASNVAGTGPDSGPSAGTVPATTSGTLSPAQGDGADGMGLVPQPVAASRAPAPGPDAPAIAGFNLTPRTLVPGVGSTVAYSLSEPASVTLTFRAARGRGRGTQVVYRIAEGRPGAAAGASKLRLLYSRASARTKRGGPWTVTIAARTADGAVTTRSTSIVVRTAG